MAQSKLFKHGQYVLNVGPDEDGTDIGKVLTHIPLVGKRKKRYQEAINGALHGSPIGVGWVICEWSEPYDITWIYEQHLRLATQAEIVLYAVRKR